jgi:hypothetical protein
MREHIRASERADEIADCRPSLTGIGLRIGGSRSCRLFSRAMRSGLDAYRLAGVGRSTAARLGVLTILASTVLRADTRPQTIFLSVPSLELAVMPLGNSVL